MAFFLLGNFKSLHPYLIQIGRCCQLKWLKMHHAWFNSRRRNGTYFYSILCKTKYVNAQMGGTKEHMVLQFRILYPKHGRAFVSWVCGYSVKSWLVCWLQTSHLVILYPLKKWTKESVMATVVGGLFWSFGPVMLWQADRKFLENPQGNTSLLN